MANTVQVQNIAPSTEDKEIKDFFSFCGKISSISVTPSTDSSTKSATVTFEKETAAKTALLLNHTKLGPTEITVTSSDPSASSDDGHSPTTNATRDTDEITQEEKPRARILAEYLAHGYLVADTGLQRAIALDEKHGVTQRFLGTLQALDARVHATDRAKTADTTYGLSGRAGALWSGLGSYFEKATSTPTGKKVVEFYTTGQRQVADIYSEAKRLADLKKEEAGGSSYKAAGLDKVFGPEGGKKPEGGQPGAATGSSEPVKGAGLGTSSPVA
ncbi:putative rna recognition domain-protein [Podospora conica]|nr:putative rna recognition domain-protein [Schizothecium conicum]